ncbi:ESCRT-I complex subunit TSG101 [Geosmithia morbida]|uniref:ESCRT-I complex subunit TSG101 n=1 Tax=Geosmithia morbida TaxID=1094350 RepID=A0A9P4Z0M2_9HYPO|nr:ESCRT-I complex subunit TSG101 [Geosmithia morbida]KAF4125967.1 ESCRT-I complex subunit TSG101 [Geosmithia morbida]
MSDGVLDQTRLRTNGILHKLGYIQSKAHAGSPRPSTRMPVQQHVLNWLYSVLTSEYHDVNRTYNDVAQALAQYPSLAPRTDVHTFPNGYSALLLHLSGTLPVNFRGNIYRFPVSVWVPHAYPREPPIIYVTPTGNMVIRPGQHIDPQGQVYHPYLVGWAEYWDKSTVRDLLALLCDVFAKEPPVIARQPPRQTQHPQPVQSPPPVPPLPSQVASRSASHEQPRPPPPPPKMTPQEGQQPFYTGSPLPQTPGLHQAQPLNQLPSRPLSSTMSPFVGSLGHGTHYPQPSNAANAASHGQWQQPGYQAGYQQPTATSQQGGMEASWNRESSAPQPQNSSAQPPPDLLDEPLTLELPGQSSVAPPPIPPNPEKDALLSQLAQTLALMRQHNRQQNESSMAGLQAQRNAMLSVLPAMQSEMGQLTQLSNVLTSNTAILHEALNRADGVIEGSKSHPAPNIDELLVAPTIVANQLYLLVAEERALGDAVFMLGRAVERGRITPAVFAKMTRSLAREWYFKSALVRKIALGMGLWA